MTGAVRATANKLTASPSCTDHVSVDLTASPKSPNLNLSFLMNTFSGCRSGASSQGLQEVSRLQVLTLMSKCTRPRE